MELLHHARSVPSLPLSKTLQLGELREPRKKAQISWTALFLKAYGLVAAEIPELRRSYIPYPWGYFYEHPESVATVLVERELPGEHAVFGGRIRMPADRPLEQIDAILHQFREAPIERTSYFRQSQRLGRLPGFLRRLVFWHSLYLSGHWRAKRFGTFMISSLGSLGVEQHHPLTFLTTYLTYGPIDPCGAVNVKIIYDHRVLDGRTVARALVALEQAMNGPILREVLEISRSRGEARAA